MPDALLTPADVARRLSLSKTDAVYKLINTGALAAVNVSAGEERKRWRVSPEALEEFPPRDTHSTKWAISKSLDGAKYRRLLTRRGKQPSAESYLGESMTCPK